MSTITSLGASDNGSTSRTTINTNFTNLNTDKVEGPASSVDSELALFSSTTGKILKRASSTGIVKETSGVVGVITDSAGLAASISDETGSGLLVFGTSPTLTTPVITTPTITTPTIKTWDGWNTVSDAWSYASATTITVPTGAASLYQVGDKFKLTANSVVLKGYIITVADTLLTVVGDTLTNNAFSAIAISHVASPVGFSPWFNYTPTGPTNTTLTGRFSLNGRLCTVQMKGVLTSGTVFTNMPTLPITASASMIVSETDYNVVGVGGYLDSGTANKTQSIAPHVGASNTYVRLDSVANSAVLSATNPITWAIGDTWWVYFSYEI